MILFLSARPVVHRAEAACAAGGGPAFLRPYRRLFAAPGTVAFTLTGLLGRLPGAMLGVATVLMVALARDSYALAGAVSATGAGVTAVTGPLLGRLVDRYGQARVAVPGVTVFALGALTMVGCVRYDAPSWTLFACAVGSAAFPSLGSMTRARWSTLFAHDPVAQHTAASFEQVVDEVCFMAGPALGMVLCTTAFPEAGMLTATGLLVVGTLSFAAQRATEPAPHPATEAMHGRAPWGVPALRVMLVCFVVTGAVFGAMEVATIATVQSYGASSVNSSVVLTLQAAGSCLSGLVCGALPLGGSVVTRFLTGVAAMALAVPPLLAADGLGGLAVLLFVAGMATAPTMITGTTLILRLVPPARLNEGMTTAYTGLLIGISAGAAADGWTVEHLGVDSAYGTPAVAAALALVVALAGAGRLRAAMRR